jgi:hypothetical protein
MRRLYLLLRQSIDRSLVDVHIIAKFESSTPLLKVVECCRELKNLVFGDRGRDLMLERSDILAVASIPRLRSLKIAGCGMTDEACSAISRYKGLNDLSLEFLADPAVLVLIGRKLVNLELLRPSKEVVDGIVDNCPKIQYLELDDVDFDDEEK